MKKLWFENSKGEKRVIKDCCNTWEEVNQAIDDFITDCNARYPLNKKRPFVRYYSRCWESDGYTKIDVGSHTEFFLWEGKFRAMTPDADGKVEFEYD